MPPIAKGRSTVPEDMNVEFAHKLVEHKPTREARRWDEVLEIVEAIGLALIAVATAWSGYQAARWDGRQALLYGQASTMRIEADQQLTEGGQQRLLDVSTFNTWIQARATGDERVAALYVDRFSPEYRVAFDAWLKTHPFTNADAPAGPIFMPEYHNAQLEEGASLNDHASAVFDEGTHARETAEQYARMAVLLATVLFIFALSQRFKIRNVRIGLLVVGAAVLIYVVLTIVGMPRL